jgi:uridine phosphorylase
MNKSIKDNEVLYHVGLSKDTIQHAEYAILINDKQYVEDIAKSIDKNAVYVNENREYFTYLADIKSQKVAVISTGLGSPAMGIGIEEMATLGLKYFVRLGEIGALQPGIEVGDLILSKAAMRYEGTSHHYAPGNYPAVASLEMTNTFHDSLKHNKVKFHYGVTATTDTFWPAQGRKSSFMKFVPKKFETILEEWGKYKVLGVEMEVATLFTLCNVFGLEAVAVLDVTNKNYQNENIEEINSNKKLKTWNKFLKHSLELDMYTRGII